MIKRTFKSLLAIFLFSFCFMTVSFMTVTQARAGDDGDGGKEPSRQAREKTDDGSSNSKPYAEDAIKHYNKGVELHHSGFFNQSIDEYKKAIDADPRIAEAYSNLGAVYLTQRSYSKAEDAFNKALSLKPNRPTTLNGLGNALYARGKTEQAKEKWKEAIAVDAGFSSAYYNLGNAYESEKNHREALAEYMKAIEANGKMADAYFRVAMILHRLKRPAQAEVFFNQAVQLAPEADFAKEARKLLTEIHTEFSKEKESASGELEMNLVPPRAPGSEAATTHSADTDREKTLTKAESRKKNESASKPDRKASADEPRRRGLFRRRQKEEKKVEMFLQPPEQAQDLKPTPTSTETRGADDAASNNPWN